jgi:hypothetical protein
MQREKKALPKKLLLSILAYGRSKRRTIGVCTISA